MREHDEPTAAEYGRYVFIERARCPACSSDDLKTQKTRPRETDGSVTRETLCRNCHWSFFVIVD